MVSIKTGVPAPSAVAIPSQVAERTKRLGSSIPLISQDSKISIPNQSSLSIYL
jgi:hypothetical protein